VEANIIRIIDLAFVGKDADGDVVAFELSDLDDDVQEKINTLDPQSGGLLNDEDLMAAAEELDPNSSAALLVWEDVWAARVAQAIRDADGVVLDIERVPHEIVQAAREWAAANT
jgi:hypothetical protein